jgi:hypothetical protein
MTTTETKQSPADFTALACIVTKFHGPTDTKGSRISARRGDHRPGDKTAWVSYDHEYSGVQAHAAAALKLIEICGLDWVLSRSAGFTADAYIFTVEGFER